MKYLNEELKILKFELFQCKDIKTGKNYANKNSKVEELTNRIKALENVIKQYH